MTPNTSATYKTSYASVPTLHTKTWTWIHLIIRKLRQLNIVRFPKDCTRNLGEMVTCKKVNKYQRKVKGVGIKIIIIVRILLLMMGLPMLREMSGRVVCPILRLLTVGLPIFIRVWIIGLRL